MNNILLAGNKVFIRTVTYHYTGEIVSVCSGMVVLKNAAWIADEERFSDMLTKGLLKEVDPFPDAVGIMLTSIVDITIWRHPLPVTQK